MPFVLQLGVKGYHFLLMPVYFIQISFLMNLYLLQRRLTILSIFKQRGTTLFNASKTPLLIRIYLEPFYTKYFFSFLIFGGLTHSLNPPHRTFKANLCSRHAWMSTGFYVERSAKAGASKHWRHLDNKSKRFGCFALVQCTQRGQPNVQIHNNGRQL